jgi:hypothetical protein
MEEKARADLGDEHGATTLLAKDCDSETKPT